MNLTFMQNEHFILFFLWMYIVFAIAILVISLYSLRSVSKEPKG